jgi:hypothetical protein
MQVIAQQFRDYQQAIEVLGVKIRREAGFT